MKSIGFPKMFGDSRTSTTIITDKEATSNNLKLLVASSKGELLGDPFFGTKTKQYTFEQNDKMFWDLCEDDLYTNIRVFIPQVVTLRKNINVYRSDFGKMVADVKVVNQDDFSVERFNLVLFQEGE